MHNLFQLNFIYSLGTENYWKEIDSKVWLNAMFNESEQPGQFYTNNFKQWADLALQEFNMVQEDIGIFDCKDIYLHLINHPDNFTHSESTS